MDVVIAFLGYAIIADFSAFFYTALGENPDKDLLTAEGFDELLFTVRKTSSPNAHADIKGNELHDPALDYLKEPKFEIYKFKLDQMGDDNFIHIGFTERSLFNQILCVIYRLFRLVYVSIWFYFFPLLGLLGSFYIPYFIKTYFPETEVTKES